MRDSPGNKIFYRENIEGPSPNQETRQIGGKTREDCWINIPMIKFKSEVRILSFLKL